MKGLKTQETNKFMAFFGVVQKFAELKNAVFFLDAGDGRDFETDELEGEDLQGWLIPAEKESAFNELWKKDEIPEEWDEYFCFALWEREGDEIKIRFE